MDNVTELLVKGAAGAAGGATYVDDVFSTYVYRGNGSNRTITNNIDLAGEGGLVWAKGRTVGYYNNLQDNVSGLTGTAKYLTSNENHIANLASASEGSTPWFVSAFNNNGFDLGVGGQVNMNTYDFASWTFRRQKGFFDIVTWTGNGSTRTIAHNLGSVPGCIMIKRTDAQATWIVYHKGLGYYTTDPSDYAMQGLNNLDAKVNYTWLFQSAATATGFEIGTGDYVNANGGSYVAYIFADDDQQFGENGDQSIIKCGYYTGSGSPNLNVNLGFEPQWLLIKNADRASTNWMLFDSMRGIFTGANDAMLHPNSSGAESSPADLIDLTATGFKVQSTQNDDTNQSGEIFLYIAIRRPDAYVGKPAEAGTDVFNMVRGNSSTTVPALVSGFPVDFRMAKTFSSAANWYQTSRLTDNNEVTTNLTFPASTGGWTKYDSNTGEGINWDSTYQGWMWKRHAGFDLAAYKGSGSADYVYHSLGKIPEMIWVKKIVGGNGDWRVYHKALGTSNDPFDYSLKLNGYGAQIDDATVWNDAAPEINRFTVGTHADVNATGSTYLSMIFASVEGISKVGSYVGSDSELTITTGFQPRFVIIKGYDSNFMDWYVLDTLRGWGSGNDPYLALNSNTAQGGSSDWGAPTSTGFTLTGNNFTWNDLGYNYIYYAHA